MLHKFLSIVVSSVLLFVLTLSSAVAETAASQRMTAAEDAWREWAKRNGASRSQFAIAYEGRVLRRRQIGIGADEPMQIQSLSKAITGSCVERLKQTGAITSVTRLDEIEGALHQLVQDNPDAGKITIDQLLTHTSGLKPDITQGRIHNWFEREHYRFVKTGREALRAENRLAKTGDYFYNNANYSLLGLLVEDVTGKDYESACRTLLSDVPGISGLRVNKALKGIAAAGGWESSAADYLRFVSHLYGKGADIQRALFSIPHVEINGGAYYGPGVVFRRNRSKGANVWHFGLLCNPGGVHDGGSYFAIWGSKWSFAIIHDVCPKGSAAFELDGLMVEAMSAKPRSGSFNK